jgi:NhaP-type Na+/H+ or K+/H+ antiporter
MILEVIMLYAGLRGAVGLAMAMMVEADKTELPLPVQLRARIAFHVSGIAILTCTINGMTITALYHKLEIYSMLKLKRSATVRLSFRIQNTLQFLSK